jgi:hypothetical protein
MCLRVPVTVTKAAIACDVDLISTMGTGNAVYRDAVAATEDRLAVTIASTLTRSERTGQQPGSLSGGARGAKL